MTDPESGVTLKKEDTMTEVSITTGHDIRVLLDEADGPVTWAGSGARELGLIPEEAPPPSLLEQMRLDGSL